MRYYNMKKVQDKLRLSREKLIMFAMLLGSDYTEGVKGIGLVNAMEILKAFSSFQQIHKFKDWAMRPDVLQSTEQTTSYLLSQASNEEKQFFQLHKKFKNYWYIDQTFGSESVRSAYLKPDVASEAQLRQLKEVGKFKSSQCQTEKLERILRETLMM